MSKSLGNTIAPEEVINKYGADILRLWAISSDYSVDIRISEEILGQLVDMYRKIRNTIRFILGNLVGFNPKTDAVEHHELENIDKWLLHTLQIVTKDILKNYENWQFHLLVKDIVNFCNNELSAFYLDIVKDRLYCSGPGKERRSAQTALYYTLLNLLALSAPILAFTCDEAYWVLSNDILLPNGIEIEESIHLTDFPCPDDSFIDDQLAKTWDTLIEMRKDVLKQIEVMRTTRIIGHSLECEIDIYACDALYDLLIRNEKELSPLFVVSKVNTFRKNENPGDAFKGETFDVYVRKSSASKCVRCWRYLDSVGQNELHPTLCERCLAVVAEYYS